MSHPPQEGYTGTKWFSRSSLKTRGFLFTSASMTRMAPTTMTTSAASAKRSSLRVWASRSAPSAGSSVQSAGSSVSSAGRFALLPPSPILVAAAAASAAAATAATDAADRRLRPSTTCRGPTSDGSVPSEGGSGPVSLRGIAEAGPSTLLLSMVEPLRCHPISSRHPSERYCARGGRSLWRTTRRRAVAPDEPRAPGSVGWLPHRRLQEPHQPASGRATGFRRAARIDSFATLLGFAAVIGAEVSGIFGLGTPSVTRTVPIS